MIMFDPGQQLQNIDNQNNQTRRDGLSNHLQQYKNSQEGSISAATAGGAIVGGQLGAAGGPLGAIAGCAAGVVVGFFAGVALNLLD